MASKISSISTMAKHALLVRLARGIYSSDLAKSLMLMVSISLVFMCAGLDTTTGGKAR